MKKYIGLVLFLIAAGGVWAQDEGKGGFYNSPDYDPDQDFTQNVWNQVSYPQEILQLMKESLHSANYLKYRLEHNARLQSQGLVEDLQEDLRVMREVNLTLERQVVFWRIAAIVFAGACFFGLLSLALLRNILGSVAQEIRESLRVGLLENEQALPKQVPRRQFS